MTSIAYSWSCLNCEAAGVGDKSAADAEKHAKKVGHSATAVGVPE